VVLLVVGTALATGLVLVRALDRQVKESADRRLMDGAALFLALLDDQREDLLAVSSWLARDPDLLAALAAGDADALEEAFAAALRLNAIDEVLVADEAGMVLARRRVDRPAERGGTIGQEPGFQQAAAGRPSDGLSRGRSPVLRQEVYRPIRPADREQPIGVLRVASYIGAGHLDRFRGRTGLDASLFYGGERLATTLRREDGTALTDIGAQPSVVETVLDRGQPVLAWRTLPIGRTRSYFVPLVGPEGERAGMVSVALPVETLTAELQEQLRGILPLLALITAVSALLAYLLVRRMKAPVLHLAAAAARMRAGDLDTPIPAVREPEVAPLAEELERARRAVQENVAAAAAEERWMRAIFADLRQPVLAVGDDGRVLAGNAAAQALFGATRRLAGLPVAAVLPFLAEPPGTESDGTTWQGAVTDAAGETVHLDVTRTALLPGRLPVRDIYLLNDVSQHAELNRLREQLLYSVAHELRGPLNVLENALDVLESNYAELSADAFGRLIGSARRTAARLHALMEDLLSAGSIQSGRFTVQPRPLPVRSLIDDATEAVAALLAERGQRLVCEIDGEDVIVAADARYATQVLVNLLQNAAKYSPDGSTIRLAVAAENGVARVSVSDSGPGIPPEQQVGLFERYYRVRARGEEPGTGLGLAIAKGIVEAHGGGIGVESAPGRGTCVWFTLPRPGGGP
jgi:two-component system phosphate regulon sensor histidine kinase PhoR